MSRTDALWRIVNEALFSEEEIVNRLRQVERDGTHEVPLHFDDVWESELYKFLANECLIRWLPYPEECYVITPEGRARMESGV